MCLFCLTMNYRPNKINNIQCFYIILILNVPIFTYFQITGVLVNTGNELVFEVEDSTNASSFLFTGGPLSYNYRLSNMRIHFGSYDEIGSEHMIGGKQFPLEVSTRILNISFLKRCLHQNLVK